jgi:hypothetical protein
LASTNGINTETSSGQVFSELSSVDIGCSFSTHTTPEEATEPEGRTLAKKGEVLSLEQIFLNTDVSDIPLFNVELHSPDVDPAELPEIGTSIPTASAALPPLPGNTNTELSVANAGFSTSLPPFPQPLSPSTALASFPLTSYGRKRPRSESSFDSGFRDPGRPKNNPWKKRKV